MVQEVIASLVLVLRQINLIFKNLKSELQNQDCKVTNLLWTSRLSVCEEEVLMLDRREHQDEILALGGQYASLLYVCTAKCCLLVHSCEIPITSLCSTLAKTCSGTE